MERRDLLALAGVLTVAGASSSALAQHGEGELKAKLIHVFATSDGGSRVQVVEISNNAGHIPVTGMSARAYARNASRGEDWHQAPAKQFAINMMGDLEVEVSDGTRMPIGQGDLVYLEDITGVGHVTRVKSEVTNLFIQVDQSWDMLKWARG